MGRSCHWGLATRQNQLAWLCLVACIIIGAALWIPGVVETRRCSLQYLETCRECIESTSAGRWPCSASKQAALDDSCWAKYMSCIRTPAIVWAIGGFFLVVLIWIPGCYICCSARAPLDSQEGGGMYAPGTQDVQMAYPTGTPCGGYQNGPAMQASVEQPYAPGCGQPQSTPMFKY